MRGMAFGQEMRDAPGHAAWPRSWPDAEVCESHRSHACPHFGGVPPGELGTDLIAARKACDRAVEVLLTSRDPIELQRSGILIHELNCGISRRLPKEP